jgi:hypothetical protein
MPGMKVPARMVVCLLLISAAAPAAGSSSSARAQVGSADTSGASFRRQRAAFSTPKLDQRNAARLFLQRRGYVSVLEGVLRDDPIDAILCYIRMRLHLEFSLPHDVLVEYEPIVRPPKRNDGVPVCVLIRSWNLCTLWYVVVLATGIQVLCGFRLHIAALIAAGAWVFTILFTLGIITLLANALHLRV